MIYVYVYIHTYSLAIQDPHITACETTIVAGSLAILVVGSTLTRCNPTFDDDISTFGVGSLSELQSLQSRIQMPPPLASLISMKRCRSVRSRRKLSTSFRSRKEYLAPWGDFSID